MASFSTASGHSIYSLDTCLFLISPEISYCPLGCRQSKEVTPCSHKAETGDAPGPGAGVGVTFLPHKGKWMRDLGHRATHILERGPCDSLSLQTITTVKLETAESFSKSLYGPANGPSPCHSRPWHLGSGSQESQATIQN